MQSLSERKHKALLTALRQLEEMLADRRALQTHARDHQNEIQQLEDLFARYQELLTELGDCITAYQELYRNLTTSVLAPQIRQVRQQMDSNSAEYHELKKHLYAIRSN